MKKGLSKTTDNKFAKDFKRKSLFYGKGLADNVGKVGKGIKEGITDN